MILGSKGDGDRACLGSLGKGWVALETRKKTRPGLVAVLCGETIPEGDHKANRASLLPSWGGMG